MFDSDLPKTSNDIIRYLSDLSSVLSGDQKFLFYLALIGCFGALITIFQAIKRKKLATKTYVEGNRKIAYFQQGVCNDCSNYIAVTSDSCVSCGSTKPFDEERLKSRIFSDLKNSFCLLDSFIDRIDDLQAAAVVYALVFLGTAIAFVLIYFLSTFLTVLGYLATILIFPLLFLIAYPRLFIVKYRGWGWYDPNNLTLLTARIRTAQRRDMTESVKQDIGTETDRYIEIFKSIPNHKRKTLPWAMLFVLPQVCIFILMASLTENALKTIPRGFSYDFLSNPLGVLDVKFSSISEYVFNMPFGENMGESLLLLVITGAMSFMSGLGIFNLFQLYFIDLDRISLAGALNVKLALADA